ncbi:MAG: AraC family ligand binding domain-containing protein [Clostridia bacterium]|nr:AraC family ligand binding domain-containing protein [Clostridia bacterium]
MRLKINATLRDRGFSDINPLDCGVEQCEAGHRFGPFVRRYYLLHYVLSGKGIYRRGDTTYRLSAGQFFLIRPDEVTTYMADRQEPWTYVWIGVTGRLAARFDALDSPVGELSDLPFRELLGMLQEDFPGWRDMREEYIVTVVHRVMAALFASVPAHRHYVSRVATFIRASYMKDISVQQIADEMSVDRRHLSRQFKKRTGVGIQEYLVSVRMENAAKFLLDGYSVSETCDLCGYKDRSNFSKMFYARYGVWPSAYARS